MELQVQLQIYLIIGVGGILIAALLLSNSLLIYYVVKLYRKLSSQSSGRSSPFPINETNVYNNPAINVDDELNRRFTQYTPEPTLHIQTMKIETNKDTLKSQKVTEDVTEEFRFRHTDRGIRPDDNFESAHEGRTYFTEREYN